MNDRELLDLAAKVAGAAQEIDLSGQPTGIYDHPPEPGILRANSGGWNPLVNDGDALRLAVKLGIDLLFTFEDVEAVATMHARQEDQEMISPWACESWTLKKQDPYAATRRAIVRAAAAIGEGSDHD